MPTNIVLLDHIPLVVIYICVYVHVALDKVWHDALWATMTRFNIGKRLIYTIQQMYSKTRNTVGLVQSTIGEWFTPESGAREITFGGGFF